MSLIIGTTHTITAKIKDVDAVTIELSRDNGSNWTQIATNVAITHATVGDEEVYEPLSYDWTVTGPAASQCKIRITGVSPNTSILDISDVAFAIEYETIPYVIKSSDAALGLMHQPDASIPGSEITFTSGVYVPTHKNTPCRCRSAELAPGGTTGVLAVHLTNDPADRVYLMPLTASNETKRYFDKVFEDDTTVTLSQVTLFPAA